MSTATPPAPSPTLLTAAEFARRYGGQYVELVDGVVKELPVPFQEHGKVCNWAAFFVTEHVVSNDLGHVTTNDSFVKTMSDPDRVRGADVCFFSYERLPRGPMPKGFFEVAPDLVVEVRSPSDGWNDVFIKVGESFGRGAGRGRPGHDDLVRLRLP